jgi:predicted metallo-beta-lactamase superfamily hydrolase
VRVEDLRQLKDPMASLGIEPAIFRLVAGCLNQRRYCVPPDYARQDKLDLALERISHEMKKSGSWLVLSKQYKHLSSNFHGITDAPNVFFS